jgi:hypothetical protein
MRDRWFHLPVVRVAGIATLLCAASLAIGASAGPSGAAATAHPRAALVRSDHTLARPHTTPPSWHRAPPPVHHTQPWHHTPPRHLKIWATYYGWYTNTPPGCTTAYLTGCAHGTGTYQDPITLASDPKEFPPGTIFYYPTVKKYFEMGDYCTTCVTAWKTTHLRQVDLWIGGQGGTEFAAINCEDALTQYSSTGPVLTAFLVNPPSRLPVSKEPLFTVGTSTCFGGARTTPSHGQYENGLSKECLEDPGASGTPGTPAEVATCTPGQAGEDIGFEGDFLMVDDLCLAMTTAAPTATTTSSLEWTRCTGGPREQFEVGTGPIEWIQYQRCVVQYGTGATTLRMGVCTSATPPDQTWTFTPQP